MDTSPSLACHTLVAHPPSSSKGSSGASDTGETQFAEAGVMFLLVLSSDASSESKRTTSISGVAVVSSPAESGTSTTACVALIVAGTAAPAEAPALAEHLVVIIC